YVSLAILALTWAGSAYVAYTQCDKLPERVPIHWNIRGEPDGWTSKDNTFIIFYLSPTIMAGLLALAFVLPWISPKNFKIEGFRATYDYVFALVIIFFAYLHTVILYSAIHGAELSLKWFVGGFFLFFALLGNVLGKVKSNFWMGIRTPWTLA